MKGVFSWCDQGLGHSLHRPYPYGLVDFPPCKSTTDGHALSDMGLVVSNRPAGR